MFFFCKPKTAYELRISDWSSDVCSSDLLRQQAEGIARREHGLEQRTGLLAAANSGEGVNIPEGADVEGHFGRPEIVRLRVAMQEPAMNEVALDLREGAEEAWVVGLQEPEPEQAEQAGETGRESCRDSGCRDV